MAGVKVEDCMDLPPGFRFHPTDEIITHYLSPKIFSHGFTSGVKVEDCMDLPPGFRFHPTDEEIITHYLSPKIVSHGFTARAIGDVDLNKCEPWELPGKANMGEKEWYFFCQRDRKYPTGTRTNRATDAGYWKATGKDKEIYRGRGVLVGMKKTLVFYKGRAPKGEKTNWVMHEFRLDGKSNLANIPKVVKDEWVVCRVLHKNICLKKAPQQPDMERVGESVGKDDFFDAASTTLPALTDRPNADRSSRPGASSFLGGHDIDNDFEFKSNSSFSNLLGIEKQQELTIANPAIADAGDYYPQLPPQSSYYAFSASNMGNLYQEQETLRALLGSAAVSNNDTSSAIRKHCKVEPYSNQSMGYPSQDTGLNFDYNAEISSVVSKHYVHELDDSCGAVTDYSFFWN